MKTLYKSKIRILIYGNKQDYKESIKKIIG